MAELTENLLRLKSVHGVGSTTIWKLLRRFGNADQVFGAAAGELTEISGVTVEKARMILKAAGHDPRPEMEKAVRAGVDIIPYDDRCYPKPLLHSFDPPVVLYVRGRMREEDQVAVGIVGTRRASAYGREHALHLSAALSRSGYTIVSGLARGIDTYAHTGALDARGRTVGVLGCGFDHMYPEENRDLALEMTHSGAVISEFSMATPPSRETFPTRNRIIAGLSLGLLVIEAPLRSGSLITARLANEIGRTVFAIPGRVGDACSEGCNKLIRDGAVMVTTVDDILQELNPELPMPELPCRASAKKRSRREPAPGDLFAAERPAATAMEAVGERNKNYSEEIVENDPPPPRPRLSDEQSRILGMIGTEWRTIDDVIVDAELPPGKVTACLAVLRLQRLVEQGPGQTYRRK